MPVHPAAATGFARAADAYERGRPGHPSEAVAWLVEHAGVHAGTTVVDLAAGTGKLTRLLEPTGVRVIAVEPVAAMRAALSAAAPGVEALEGTAEAMPLPDGCADAVLVAQAFHWFAHEAALTEIHRVLRAGGRLGLIWNWRDTSQPLQAAVSAIVEPRRGDTPGHRTGEWERAFADTTRFSPIADHHLPHVQSLTRAAFLDRVLSTSFIAALPPAALVAVRAKLQALAATQPEPLELRYVTDVHVYRAR